MPMAGLARFSVSRGPGSGVELDEDIERELVGGLFLRSRASRVEIGRFLPPHERKEFAHELKIALAIPRI